MKPPLQQFLAQALKGFEAHVKTFAMSKSPQRGHRVAAQR